VQHVNPGIAPPSMLSLTYYNSRTHKDDSISCIRSMFSALVRCIRFLKGVNKCTWILNAILLYSNHRHVSTAHETIFRVIGTRTQLQL